MQKALFFLSFVFVIFTISCGEGSPFNRKLFKERALETPAPSEHNISKSFFVKDNGEKRTFLCGWAAERSRSAWGTWYTQLYHQAMHCNIEFEITEKSLVGRVIHPSYPKDRTRWIKAVEIPIVKHFYYERNRDQYGRETNEYIENDRRSHWSARPEMRLDLAGMSVQGFFGTRLTRNNRTVSIQDVEWDFENNFLGFTLNTQFDSLLANELGSSASTTLEMSLRVNFLEFESDKSFQKLPYDQRNARHFNILHVLGRKVDIQTAELYAARWDLSQSREIVISGVPREKRSSVGYILAEAVERWNQALEEIGAVPRGHKAFVPVFRDLKNSFDLRHTAIHWIDDEEVSSRSPLGIGMAHADVSNGQILWGNVVIYGGMLERFVNAYAPLSAEASAPMAYPLMGAETLLSPIALPPDIEDLKSAHVRDKVASMSEAYNMSEAYSHLSNHQLDRELQTLVHEAYGAESDNDERSFKRISEQISRLEHHIKSLTEEKLNENHWWEVVATAMEASRDSQSETQRFFNQLTTLNLLGFESLESSASISDMYHEEDRELVNLMVQRGQWDQLPFLAPQASAYSVDVDRTVENLANSWKQAIDQVSKEPALSQISARDYLLRILMDLTLHEVGHMLNLGHQFKQHILPEQGTVPSRYLVGDPEASHPHLREGLLKRATAERHFVNYTSVMGYKSGHVEVRTPLEEIYPGPHDKLVLRYLYKGEYPVFLAERDDFDFKPVPSNGYIPVEAQGKPVAYFPACNDYEASFGKSPFCGRWLRGSQAVDIVDSLFERLEDNLIGDSFNLLGGQKGSLWAAERRRWSLSLRAFSGARLFYDEMRRRLRSEPHLAPLWDRLRLDEKALYEFSQACHHEDESQIESSVLRDIFRDPSLRDLCQANAKVLSKSQAFLNLPQVDHSQVDHTQSFMHATYLFGDTHRETGQAFGQWYQLSNLPLKLTALNNLTEANPMMHFFWGPYIFAYRNPYYDYYENRPLYRSLYPVEYTNLISSAVRNNMRFSSLQQGDRHTMMGRTVLGAAYMLPRQRFQSNDVGQISPQMEKMLNQQTDFRLSITAIIITAQAPEATSDTLPRHYKRFNGTVYDFMTGKNRSLRDIYVLPQGNVFVRANNSFLFPITEMRFFTDTSFYVIAFQADYNLEVGDRLMESSVKGVLNELYESVTESCLTGQTNTGLSNFFTNENPNFLGFHLPVGIATDSGQEKTRQFYESIDAGFQSYQQYVRQRLSSTDSTEDMEHVCNEALRGTQQIMASAALMRGFWLPFIYELIWK